jgi:beta-glucosidase
MIVYLLFVLALLVLAYWIALQIFSRQDPEPSFSNLLAASASPSLPADFLLGTATSAHQVEGNNLHNDWSDFEKEGKVARGEQSGLACDAWNRFDQDLARMKELGADSYRFSLEWSRLEATEGTHDEAAWDHYAEQLQKLREAGITPMVTLLHFTLPRWISARGGVTAPDFPDKFGAFAAEAARRLFAMVDLWTTINEPNVQMFMGYVSGEWPPEKKSPEEAARAFVGLLKAHAAAARAIRHVSPEAQIGVAMNLVSFAPSRRAWLPDWLAARFAATTYNWAFYDAIQSGRIRLRVPGQAPLDEPCEDLLGSVDFLGINYYTRNIVRYAPTKPGGVQLKPGSREQSDLGWEIYPEGLLKLIRHAWRRYQLPIYITENGLADASGEKRGPFLRAHLYAIHRAIEEGAKVLGYFHWSLLDNFEWHHGYTPRFGLYRMDYATQSRTATPAVEVFRQLSHKRGEPDTPAGE